MHDYICILTDLNVSYQGVFTRFGHGTSNAVSWKSAEARIMSDDHELAEDVDKASSRIGLYVSLGPGHVRHHLRSAPRFCMRINFSA